MANILKTLWRQRRKYVLLLCGIAIGALTVTAVSIISQIGQSLLEEELDSMGLNGLIVTGTGITESHLQSIAAKSYITHQTPLCYSYGKAGIGEQIADTLIWGMDERAYETVSITLLHGRKLCDSDKGSPVCMVDKSLALQTYGRENIIGRSLKVQLSGMSISLKVIGVVDTGGSLTSMLMGNELPSFLYLPMDLLRLYTGKQGYDQLMLRLDENISADQAAIEVTSLVGGSTSANKVQNMEQSKDTLAGILNLFSYVLLAFGGICFFTCTLFSLTLMTSNVKEQTEEIGIKKALGATDFRICTEYLIQSALLSLLGSLLGCMAVLLLSLCAANLLGLTLSLSAESFLLPALPGCVVGTVCGLFPARKAAKIHPGKAISQL